MQNSCTQHKTTLIGQFDIVDPAKKEVTNQLHLIERSKMYLGF